MTYTIKQLANLAETSIRTLHHYDQIGLLSPARDITNKYRTYDESDLLKLQQILFFRELEFPLLEIKKILNNPSFDMTQALKDQKKMIELKEKRLRTIKQTIEKTIKKINHKNKMKDDELYEGLDHKEIDEYAAEAKARWGNTEAYKQSQERVAKMTKEDMEKIKSDGEALTREIAQNMDKGISSPKVQALIAKHYNALRAFYEPNLEMYRNLGKMYVDDPRFTAYYDKYASGLAVFMRDAMAVYCDNA